MATAIGTRAGMLMPKAITTSMHGTSRARKTQNVADTFRLCLYIAEKKRPRNTKSPGPMVATGPNIPNAGSFTETFSTTFGAVWMTCSVVP